MALANPDQSRPFYPPTTPATDEQGRPKPVDIGDLIDAALRWWETAKDNVSLEFSRDPDSHTERDPYTFHPSQLGKCKRQAYLSKTGLSSVPTGKVLPGVLIHAVLEAYVREKFETSPRDIRAENLVQADLGGGIQLVGTTDFYDADLGLVADFKTRGDDYFNGFHFYNGADQHQMDQVWLYLHATGADHAQVASVSKTDLSFQKVWPAHVPEIPSDYLKASPRRVSWLVENRAKPIRDEIDAHGVAAEPSEIPFEKCDCWMCDYERLTFE
ncbi:PD-(D/E)XK nuclease family protein [Halobacterium rubrum]|uniref:hypothetical protein n=1 Tax=Halobacterium TaxID=2239 RepID=UPI001F479A39|nr:MULTISPECIES: hypothetical protein [Halobacterium]MDH5021752.1 hypothetical protein [Halobacterium rubrum]